MSHRAQRVSFLHSGRSATATSHDMLNCAATIIHMGQIMKAIDLAAFSQQIKVQLKLPKLGLSQGLHKMDSIKS